MSMQPGTAYPISNYIIMENVPLKPLVIKDIGPWDKYMSVTNNAERVVAALVSGGFLADRRRLLYYDSENNLDEILVKDGKFAGFAPVAQR